MTEAFHLLIWYAPREDAPDPADWTEGAFIEAVEVHTDIHLDSHEAVAHFIQDRMVEGCQGRLVGQYDVHVRWEEDERRPSVRRMDRFSLQIPA